MKIGKLRHRVTIQKLISTPDGGGGSTKTWIDDATVWAAIEPLRGGERYVAQQVQSELTHKITMRYREGIKPQMRIKYKDRIKDRIFEIWSVIDIDERRIWLEMLCSEVVR